VTGRRRLPVTGLARRALLLTGHPGVGKPDAILFDGQGRAHAAATAQRRRVEPGLAGG
jgi:hypothetical protein